MQINTLLFSKESRGGAGVFLKQMHLLDKKRHKIFLYKKDKLSSLSHSDAQYIIEKYPEDEQPSLYKVALFLRSVISTYKILRLENPKNILACDRYSATVILTLKFFRILMKDINVFILINNNVPELDKRKSNFIYRYILQASNKILYKKADKIIITSKKILEYLTTDIRYNVANCIYIPHAVDFSKIDKQFNRKNKILAQMASNKKFKIISVGRLDSQKDFSTIIHAFHLALLHEKKNEMHLYIVGEGNEKEKLKKLIKELKITKDVTFIGWQKNIYPFLQLADIFVFSSFHEGFGTVIVEAMAVGLPVIATDTPFGPSEILKNGKYGILVPIMGKTQMAEKIIYLMKNKKLRKLFASKSVKRSKDFDVRSVIKTYTSLFNL